MRIAYICSDFGIPVHLNKGAAVHVRELSRALRALGHEVLIYTPRMGADAPPEFSVPVREYALERDDKDMYHLLLDDPNAGKPVAKAFRSLVYASSLRRRLRKELSVFAPDMIYERYSLYGTAGSALARELNVPLVLEVNAPLSYEEEAHRQLAFPQTAHAVEREILCSADHVIAVSSELARWLIREGVSSDRVTVQPNAVDVSRFALTRAERDQVRAALGMDERPVVGFLGTLKPWHGTEALLRALARLGSQGLAPHLLVVGDGPERRRLEDLAKAEGIEHLVRFTGAVAHERIPAYLSAMDIATAPYDLTGDFYFSPLKLFEYMAAGLPVVAADVGQIRECVRHQETGLMYPPGDIFALTAALAELLQDPVRAVSLGRAARLYVCENHTWEGNAKTVVRLVEQSAPISMGVG